MTAVRRNPGSATLPHRLHHLAFDLTQTLLARYNATTTQPLALMPVAVQEGWCMECAEWVEQGHQCGGQHA